MECRYSSFMISGDIRYHEISLLLLLLARAPHDIISYHIMRGRERKGSSLISDDIRYQVIS